MQMVMIEDECVGCPGGMGCLGSACPNRNVKHYICDKCKDDVETLYEFEGEQLCIDCIEERLKVVE